MFKRVRNVWVEKVEICFWGQFYTDYGAELAILSSIVTHMTRCPCTCSMCVFFQSKLEVKGAWLTSLPCGNHHTLCFCWEFNHRIGVTPIRPFAEGSLEGRFYWVWCCCFSPRWCGGMSHQRRDCYLLCYLMFVVEGHWWLYKIDVARKRNLGKLQISPVP